MKYWQHVYHRRREQPSTRTTEGRSKNMIRADTASIWLNGVRYVNSWINSNHYQLNGTNTPVILIALGGQNKKKVLPIHQNSGGNQCCHGIPIPTFIRFFSIIRRMKPFPFTESSVQTRPHNRRATKIYPDINIDWRLLPTASNLYKHSYRNGEYQLLLMLLLPTQTRSYQRDNMLFRTTDFQSNAACCIYSMWIFRIPFMCDAFYILTTQFVHKIYGLIKCT